MGKKNFLVRKNWQSKKHFGNYWEWLALISEYWFSLQFELWSFSPVTYFFWQSLDWLMLDFWLWSYHTHYKTTCKFKSFLNCQCMYNKAVTRKDILEERLMSSLCSLTWDCVTPWIKFTLWNIFVSIVYGMKFTRGNSPEVIVNLLASPTGFKVKPIEMSGVNLTIIHFFPQYLNFHHSL